MLFAPLIVLVVLAADESKSHRPETAQLSIATATQKLASHIREKKPGAILDKEFAVKELTTDNVWKVLGVQIFKVNAGAVALHESFVLRGETVLPIGQAFGGDGVTSVVAADLVGDKRPLLIYAFAWGSGRHRSEIGILDLDAKEPNEIRLSPTNRSHTDYRLRVGENGSVEVLVGKILVGRVTAMKNDGKLSASIGIVEGLADELRQQLK
jgi:hypothetical protein